jgi:hypothetical protein
MTVPGGQTERPRAHRGPHRVYGRSAGARGPGVCQVQPRGEPAQEGSWSRRSRCCCRSAPGWLPPRWPSRMGWHGRPTPWVRRVGVVVFVDASVRLTSAAGAPVAAPTESRLVVAVCPCWCGCRCAEVGGAVVGSRLRQGHGGRRNGVDLGYWRHGHRRPRGGHSADCFPWRPGVSAAVSRSARH